MLHEVVTDDGPRLEKLAREVQRIALTLNELVASRPSNLSNEFIGFAAITTLLGDNAASVTAADVRNIIRLRRLRNQFFRPSLFGEPAWDMLLDLMAARLEGASVAVSSLCVAAAVPQTTALRWIKRLTDRGMLVRQVDNGDGRRVFIELSEGAAMGMNAYLSAAKAQGGLAI